MNRPLIWWSIWCLKIRKNPHARIRAAARLGNTTLPKAVEALSLVALSTTAIDRQQPDVRQAAMTALGQIGNTSAAEALARVVGSEQSYDFRSLERAVAEEALLKIANSTKQPLIELLGSSPHWNARAGVAWALGKIGDPQAVEALARALNDKASEVRKAATTALTQFHAVAPLLKGPEDKNESVRAAAAEGLGEIGDASAADALADILKYEKVWNVRQKAMWALARIGDERAVEPLAATLKEGDFDDQYKAAVALGKIGGVTAAEVLVAVLPDTNSFRKSWAEALVKIGSSAVEPLVTTLKTGEWRLQYAVMEVLVQIGSPAVEHLLALLKDVNSRARSLAARALGQIADERAVPTLVSALNDDAYMVRIEAVTALEPLGWKPADDNQYILQAAAHGNWDELVTRGSEAVDLLIAALKDENTPEPWRIALLLGRIGDPRSVEPLVAALKHDHLGVREAAAEALAQIRGSTRGGT
ncbi:MAG: HEAT repeat domain-containing protein [Deltaproteobacteria bacterium]|nr:HEAT repeat domain-containing protein [Deltaproteobacteria bacterium]